ncbi:hypothetical protein CKN80_00915 [Carnobacterium divergens]|nr:hypothetical protein CKN79_00915 [Carnobacterium divergens]TFJ55018.1 hypothetical protein CKN80_00915 [Carnobacterium divergens]
MQYWYVSINNSYKHRGSNVRSIQMRQEHSIVELTEEATPKDIDNCKLVYLGRGWWNDKHIQNNYNNYTGVVT